MKKLMISLLMLILLSSLAHATNELVAKGNYVQTYGQEISSGQFQSAIMLFERETSSTNIAKGSDYNPLILDSNGDGNRQIIVMQTNTLNVLNYSYQTNIISTTKTASLVGSQKGQMSAFNTSTGKVNFVIPTTAGIYQYEYNESSLNQIHYLNFSNHSSMTQVAQGIRCGVGSTTSGLQPVYCWWLDTTGNVITYNPNNYNTTNTSVYDGNCGENGGLPLGDIDSDTNKELGLVCDYNANSRQGLKIYDTQTGGVQLTVNDLDLGHTTSSEIRGLSFYDLDGGGGREIIVSILSRFTTNYYTGVSFLTSSGTTYATNWQTSTMIDPVSSSNLIVGDVIDNGGETVTACSLGLPSYITYYILGVPVQFPNPFCVGYELSGGGTEVCQLYSSNSNDVPPAGIKCWSNNNQTTTYSHDYPKNAVPTYRHILGADLNQDEYIDLIDTIGVNYPNLGNTAQNDSFNLDSGGNIVVADLNGDGQAEFIGSKASDTYVIQTIGDNDPPNQTQTYKRNWENPLCLNTTLEFSVKEYDELIVPQTGGTSYNNDFDLDQERIITDCGVGTTNTGGWSQSEPSMQCRYNATGTYIVKLYLEDSFNVGDRTVLSTENVVVIDGLLGLTCNVESSDDVDLIIPASEDAITPTIDGVDDAVDLLTGGDVRVKAMMGFILLLIIMVGTAWFSKSFAVAAVMSVLGVIILTIMGFFEIWVLVLFMLLLIAGAILVAAFRGGGA